MSSISAVGASSPPPRVLYVTPECWGVASHVWATREALEHYIDTGQSLANPIGAGGLGGLSGDHAKAAADLGLPMTFVCPLPTLGYGIQRVDGAGNFRMDDEPWNPEDAPYWFDTGRKASFNFGSIPTSQGPYPGRTHEVTLKIWRQNILGKTRGQVPIFGLQSDYRENANGPWQAATQRVYPDQDKETWQRILLDTALAQAWRIYTMIHGQHPDYIHLNESDSCMAAAAVVRELGFRASAFEDGGDAARLEHPSVLQALRAKVRTTLHTPERSGFPTYDWGHIRSMLWRDRQLYLLLRALDKYNGNRFNPANIGVNAAGIINGVSVKHAEVLRRAFYADRESDIQAITNGVHYGTWICDEVKRVIALHSPTWEEDNDRLNDLEKQKNDNQFKQDFFAAHQEAKGRVVRLANHHTDNPWDLETFTPSLARRIQDYKRHLLLLNFLLENQDECKQRLRALGKEGHKLQLAFAGLEHRCSDQALVKEIYQKIQAVKEAYRGLVKAVFIPNYKLEAGKILVSGSDLWLCTSRRYREACYTSPQEAAGNGVPHLGFNDGIIREFEHDEGKETGWVVGEDAPDDGSAEMLRRDGKALFEGLMEAAGMYYSNRDAYVQRMVNSIVYNTKFNAHRMVRIYYQTVYVPSYTTPI